MNAAPPVDEPPAIHAPAAPDRAAIASPSVLSARTGVGLGWGTRGLATSWFATGDVMARFIGLGAEFEQARTGTHPIVDFFGPRDYVSTQSVRLRLVLRTELLARAPIQVNLLAAVAVGPTTWTRVYDEEVAEEEVSEDPGTYFPCFLGCYETTVVRTRALGLSAEGLLAVRYHWFGFGAGARLATARGDVLATFVAVLGIEI